MKLKHCPFCGCEAEVHTSYEDPPIVSPSETLPPIIPPESGGKQGGANLRGKQRGEAGGRLPPIVPPSLGGIQGGTAWGKKEDTDAFNVRCETCYARTGWYRDEKQAAKAWNMRPEA